MIIRKPITANIDPNNHYSTWLHFDGGAKLKFYMRGAIAWPQADNEGFAMMAGVNLLENVIYIFEQFRFWTVEHWLDPDGRIRPRDDHDHTQGYHLGLIQFLQDCEAKYKCCSFFYGGQHIDVNRRHLMEVYRNKLLPNRVELIEVPYVSEVGDDLILEKFHTRKFRAENKSLLADAVEQWINLQAAGTGDNNIVHAFRALLAGFEHQPWVKQHE